VEQDERRARLEEAAQLFERAAEDGPAQMHCFRSAAHFSSEDGAPRRAHACVRPATRGSRRDRLLQQARDHRERASAGARAAGSVRAGGYRERVPARIYAIANQKGGVGKTTTAVNLAACLAEAGERCLIVDLDPQANATSGLGLRANGHSTLDLLDGTPLGELVTASSVANLDLVPAKAELAAATVHLSALEDGERYLADALREEATAPYAFVFLDCPPSFGPLTVNALAAADRVVVPVQAEYYALEGLSQLLGSIDLVKRRLNPRLGVAGILLTMVDGRTRLAEDVEHELRSHFGGLVFTQTVPRSVRLAEAPSHGLPVIAYDRRSAGAEAYWKVAMELVDRT